MGGKARFISRTDDGTSIPGEQDVDGRIVQAKAEAVGNGSAPGLRMFPGGTEGQLRELIAGMKRHGADGVRFVIMEDFGNVVEAYELRRLDKSLEDLADEMHERHSAQAERRAEPEIVRDGCEGVIPAEVEEIMSIVRAAAAHERQGRDLCRRAKALGEKLAESVN